MFNMILS